MSQSPRLPTNSGESSERISSILPPAYQPNTRRSNHTLQSKYQYLAPSSVMWLVTKGSLSVSKGRIPSTRRLLSLAPRYAIKYTSSSGAYITASSRTSRDSIYLHQVSFLSNSSFGMYVVEAGPSIAPDSRSWTYMCSSRCRLRVLDYLHGLSPNSEREEKFGRRSWVRGYWKNESYMGNGFVWEVWVSQSEPWLLWKIHF